MDDLTHPQEEERFVGPWGRTALTAVGVGVLLFLGSAAGAAVAMTVWALGTAMWALLLLLWPSGPIRITARRRGPWVTLLWSPLAFPFGIGAALYGILDLLGSLGF